MPNTLRLCAVVGLLSISVGMLGCGCSGDEVSNPGTIKVTESPAESVKSPEIPPAPLFKDWPQPALAIVFSGNQHGYLEPCGCSLTQSGGISRRANLFKQMEQKNWPVTAFDVGGLVRRNREQSRYKFQTLVAALQDMHYQALQLGVEELRLGPDYLLSQHVYDANQPEASLAFLAANLVLFNSPDLGTPVPKKVVTIDGVKLGVTGIVGKSLISEILPGGSSSDISVSDPAEALAKVVPSMEAEQPDVLILLAHADLDEAKSLATAFPQFNLILCSGGPQTPDPQPQKIGDALLFSVGEKGQNVGVVGFYPDDAEQRFRYEVVELDNRRFQDTPQMREHMRSYQELLRDTELAVRELRVDHPRGTEFVGAAKCGECHTKAYAKWKKDTKHARAFESLKKGRKGQEAGWISRIHDPECLACHVTGWNPQDVIPYASGYVDEATTLHLAAQQCENCHGPGKRHTDLEEAWAKDRQQVNQDQLTAARKEQHLTQEVAHKRVCTQCHDLDNSPGFKFEKYWEEVKHPWRD